MKYFIKTFGCQQNTADSQRIETTFKNRGMRKTNSVEKADYVVINTCMVRQSAENRVYGLVNNLKESKLKPKIIVTGCMVGLAMRDKTGKFFKKIREAMPNVDEFMPIEEVGFDNEPLRQDKTTAWVPISNGCNNFCTYCVVPLSRGREISRPFDDILKECQELKNKGYKNITLLGQNVNSYGSDLIKSSVIPTEVNDSERRGGIPSKTKGSLHALTLGRDDKKMSDFKFNGKTIKPVYVKHLGRLRIPTLFPHLLEAVAKMGFKKVYFMSSNPWDFSDELIEVIAKYPNITRVIHLPVQSGDDNVLKRMNRWYTAQEYIDLVSRIKDLVSDVKFTTDIIVGFCGETEEEFENTIKLVKKVGFEKAYVSIYSVRPGTAATKNMQDDIPHKVKKQRWLKLDRLIYKPKSHS